MLQRGCITVHLVRLNAVFTPPSEHITFLLYYLHTFQFSFFFRAQKCGNVDRARVRPLLVHEFVEILETRFL